MPGFKLTFDEHVQFMQDASEGMHYKDLMKKYKISEPTAHRLMHRQPTKNRKYANSRLNTGFFKSINTEAKAYWLGFIAADGGVYGNRVQLSCAAKDFEHINSFVVETLCSTNKPWYNVKTDSYQFNIFSDEMRNDLRNLGIVERKTFKLKFPKLSDKLIHHFIRGYFDGDGSISYSKTNKCPQYNILGTFAFLNTLRKLAGLPVSILWNRSIRMIARCGKNVCRSFYDYLYRDAEIFLTRKKLRFEEVC